MSSHNLRSCAALAIALMAGLAAAQSLPAKSHFPVCAQTCVGVLNSTSCDVSNFQKLSCCLTQTCDSKGTADTFEVANKACHAAGNSSFSAVATCVAGYSFIGAATSTTASGVEVVPPLPTAFGGSAIDTAFFASQQSTIVLSTGYPATILPIANFTSTATSRTPIAPTAQSSSTRPSQLPTGSTSGVAPFNSDSAAARDHNVHVVDALLVAGGALVALL